MMVTKSTQLTGSESDTLTNQFQKPLSQFRIQCGAKRTARCTSAERRHLLTREGAIAEGIGAKKNKFQQAPGAVLQQVLCMGNEPGIRKLTNGHIVKWVEEQAALCRPDSIFWCDGSEEEKKALTRVAVNA